MEVLKFKQRENCEPDAKTPWMDDVLAWHKFAPVLTELVAHEENPFVVFVRV